MDEIPETVAEVRRAFEDGRSRPLTWRKEQLTRIGDLLRQREGELLEALAADLGRPKFEGYLAEVGFVAAEVEHALKHLDSWVKPERVPTPLINQIGTSKIHREPLGVVLVIAPWNYPIHLTLAPLVGAIAAGNCAVLKPSELAPASSAVLAKWLPKYLDNRCIRVVEGAVPETQVLLAERFDHIFFTGGGVVARIVLQAASRHLTPVTLELGGKSPCIVDQDTDLDVAARRIMWGKFLNTGQTCVAPDYVLCHESIEQALLDRMRTTLREFYGPDPRESPDLGRIVNDRHFKRLLGYLDGGEVFVGGEHDESQRYIAPTILRNVDDDATVMQEEIFGPILPVRSVRNIDEALAFINARPKPLALYVFSSDKEVQRRVIERTSSGGVCVNDVAAQMGVPDLPFGGVGASGIGAYHGRTGIDLFSHRKAVLEKSTILDPPLRYPPYSPNKYKWIKRVM